MQPRVLFPKRTDWSSPAGEGFILRMRAWFAAMTRRSRAARCRSEESGGRFASTQDATPLPNCAAGPIGPICAGTQQKADGGGGAIVAFPRNGQSRLVMLARDLKRRFTDLGLEQHEPFLLDVSISPAPRLWIDHVSHVEFRGDRSGYRVVLADIFETRITLETADFDAVTQFVDHYIIARMTEFRDTGAGQ